MGFIFYRANVEVFLRKIVTVMSTNQCSYARSYGRCKTRHRKLARVPNASTSLPPIDGVHVENFFNAAIILFFPQTQKCQMI